MQKYSDVVLDKNGKPVQGADVTVKTYPDGQAATIYGADGGPAVASVKTDSAGRFAFYAANGHYSVTVSGTGITPVDYNDIVLFDPKDSGAAAMVGNGGETVADSFNALQLADYAALRAYAGPRKSVYVTGYLATSAPSGIAGMFVRDDSDSTSADNSGTVIVAANGKRWKRRYADAISVQWFAGLAAVVNAKSPGDAASHTATSFTSWRAPIQAALDAAYAAGGATVFVPGAAAPYLLDDYIRIKANTKLVCGGTLKLADYTTVGAAILLDGNNIELVTPLLDNSSIYAGGSGQNGVGHISGGNIKVRGGLIQNCARGNAGGMDGGKAFQFESTNGHVIVDGVTIINCFMAMSAQHDFTQTTACGPLMFSNITAENCPILLFVRQVGGTDTTGQAHSISLTSFIAKNCGTLDGLMQFSRAANVLVSNGSITNSTKIPALVRGNVRYGTFDNLQFEGDCGALINLDPSQYAVDASYAQVGNIYSFHHVGIADYVAWADPATVNRVLQDGRIYAHLSNDVTTKIVGDELRNAFTKIEIQQGGRSICTTTAALYLGAKAKMANFAAGNNIGSINADQSGTWIPTDNSGAALDLTGAYGDYVKVGRMVFASFSIVFPATATTFSTSIAGLPFASSNNSGHIVCGLSLRYTDYGGLITALNNPGASTFSFGNATGAVLKNSDVSGKTIQGILMYIADA